MELSETLDAYKDAWNATSEAETSAHLEKAVTPDAVLMDPHGVFTGTAAIAAFIAAARQKLGSAQLVATSSPQRHPHAPWIRYDWAVHAGETSIMSGTDVVELTDDGRLARIVTFLPEETA